MSPPVNDNIKRIRRIEDAQISCALTYEEINKTGMSGQVTETKYRYVDNYHQPEIVYTLEEIAREHPTLAGAIEEIKEINLSSHIDRNKIITYIRDIKLALLTQQIEQACKGSKQFRKYSDRIILLVFVLAALTGFFPFLAWGLSFLVIAAGIIDMLRSYRAYKKLNLRIQRLEFLEDVSLNLNENIIKLFASKRHRYEVDQFRHLTRSLVNFALISSGPLTLFYLITKGMIVTFSLPFPPITCVLLVFAALMFIWALKKYYDCYCEKNLVKDVKEIKSGLNEDNLVDEKIIDEIDEPAKRYNKRAVKLFARTIEIFAKPLMLSGELILDIVGEVAAWIMFTIGGVGVIGVKLGFALDSQRKIVYAPRQSSFRGLSFFNRKGSSESQSMGPDKNNKSVSDVSDVAPPHALPTVVYPSAPVKM